MPDDEVTIRARFEGMDQAQRNIALLRQELNSLGSGGRGSSSGPVMPTGTPANAPVPTTPTVVAGSGGAGGSGGGGTGIGTLGSLPPMAGGFVPGAALAPPSVGDGGSGAAGPGAGGGGIIRALSAFLPLVYAAWPVGPLTRKTATMPAAAPRSVAVVRHNDRLDRASLAGTQPEGFRP